MLDFILHTDKQDAINILKADHDKVKALFDEFKDKDRTRSKKQIVAEALHELRMHAAIEEEIFYPAVRPRIEKALMNEANEEHHVAKVLIAELAIMDGKEEHYNAKFTVLAENIRHHIKEEEGEMFPKVRSLNMDQVVLGKKLLMRKKELMANGIPATTEEKLIAAIGVTLLDSPAQAVQKQKTAKKLKAKTPVHATKTKSKPRVAALRSVTTKSTKKTTTAAKTRLKAK